MQKLYPDAAAALDGVLTDDMLIASGGFGLCGIPERLLDAIQASGVKNLTFARPFTGFVRPFTRPSMNAFRAFKPHEKKHSPPCSSPAHFHRWCGQKTKSYFHHG